MHGMDDGQRAAQRHQEYMLQTGQWVIGGAAGAGTGGHGPAETPEQRQAREQRLADARAVTRRNEAVALLRAEQWAPILPTVVPRFLLAMETAGQPGLEWVYFHRSYGQVGRQAKAYKGYALPAVAGDRHNIEHVLDRHALVVSARGRIDCLSFSDGKPQLEVGVKKHDAKRWDKHAPDFESTTVELHDRLRDFAATQGVEFDLTPPGADVEVDEARFLTPDPSTFADHMAPGNPGAETMTVFERHRGQELDTGRTVAAWPIRDRQYSVSGPGGYSVWRTGHEWVGADGRIYVEAQAAPKGVFSATPRTVLVVCDEVTDPEALPALLRVKAARWGKPFPAHHAAAQ